MEVTRHKVALPQAPGDLRVRRLRVPELLRGELEGRDLDDYVEERVGLTTLKAAGEWAQNWGRANALFPLTFGLACLRTEIIWGVGSPRNDAARFGA